MKSSPHFVEKYLAPTRFQARRSALFNLELEESILDSTWSLAALEDVCMDVLTRRVRRQTLRTHRKVLAQASMPLTVTTLKARVPNGALTSCYKAISFCEAARFDLPHQKVHIGRDHIHIFRKHNMACCCRRGLVLHGIGSRTCSQGGKG